MTAADVVLGLLGLVAVGSAVLVVTVRSVVRAALWLVVTLAAVAGCHLVMAAQFVALVQVLIYVGAIAVLLLFAVMLTRAPQAPSPDATTGNRWAALVVGAATAGLLVTLLATAYGATRVDLPAQVGADALGAAMFTRWVLPFEIVSLLLLAVLIGAIVLSRRDDTTAGAEAR